MKKLLLTVACIAISLSNYAQECSSLMEPVSLQNRTNEATLIIEGEVINSISYWDVGHKNIYTIHEVTVYKNAKGVNATTVFVETQGGQVDNLIQEVSSAARLRKGYEGIFFLKTSNHSFSIPQTTYMMVAAAQGYIKYDRIDKNALDVFNVYTSIENDLYSKLEQATNKKLVVIKEKQVASTANSFLATPSISNFSPTSISAGTKSILTINGSNFGATQGEVSFKYANDGGATYIAAQDSEVISWNDSQIQVEVPYTGGSGTIRVTNATSETGTSSSTLSIPYSYLNFVSGGNVFTRYLTSDNGNGGYTFQYHTDFNSSAAKQYFEEAFGVWNCQSGVNFTFGTTTTLDESINDNISIVRFDNGSELATGVLGQVSTIIEQACGTKGIVKELDITWNDTTNWYYGSGTPAFTQYDFKTVALHELGHAHQMGHVINSPAIMHYSLSNGQEKYALNADDIDGANYTMNLFTTSPGCGASPMTADSQCTFVPDDNFEAYLEANNMGNGIANDDLVTTANISGVVNLFIGNQGISDLTGLEDFAALVSLFVDGNTLDALDVSHNTNLEQLSFIGSNVSTLDLSTNTSLTTLAGTNNQIANLDLSSNINLEYLTFKDNLLISLDLSQNVALLTCNLDNNELTFLDIKNGNNSNITGPNFVVSGNTDLGCIKVDSETYANTNWNPQSGIFSEDCDATTYVPDDNFETYLETHDASGNTVSIGASNSMGNGIADDNTVFTYRISGVTSLTLDDLGIVNLTGIEAFLSVVTLRSYKNNVTSVDLYNNINIEELRISESIDLTTIDISTLTSLKEFWCYSNPVLVNLDVSNNIALEELFVFATDISVLNVSANSALIDLRCPSNKLTNLDVSNKPFLHTLIALNNNISSVTLNNNPVLDTLILSGNTNLETIDVSQSIALRYLDLAENGITNLDLKANTNLSFIIVNDNELTALDIKNGNNSAITDANFKTSGNPNLSCINVDSESYATANWTTYVDGTSSFNEHCNETYVPNDNFETYLETHDASGNTVSLGATNSMGNGVIDDYVTTTSINTVTGLNVNGENISNLTGIEAFLALETLGCSNTNLTTLDLSTNTNLILLAANDSGLTSINFGSLTALQIVNISNNALATIDISNNTSLIWFNVSNNMLTSIDITGCTAMTQFFVNDNTLTSLDLSLFPNFEKLNVSNNTLTTLNLRSGGNTLLDSNIDFYATGNPNLTCINVDDEAFSTTTWTNIDATTSFSEHCGLTYVPDDNFEQALIDLGYDTGALDDYVPTANISGVTFLNVTSLGISEFTGIEDFVALEDLRAPNNSFETIDVSNLSQLNKLWLHAGSLTELDVTANILLEDLRVENNQLTEIDLTNNPLLRILQINNNTVLDELDVTNNPDLFRIRAYGSSITELDLSNNIVLTEIQVHANQLTELNIQNGNNANITLFNATGNSNLTCINVDNAVDFTTLWVNAIDATASFGEHCDETYVPDDNFETYLETHDASGNTVSLGATNSMGNGVIDDYVTTTSINTVTGLNVTGENISNLIGIEDFTAITNFNCTGNQIENLNVTLNTALISLDCSSNQIASLDVTQNTLLETLHVNENLTLGTLDVSQNTALTSLDITDCQFSTIDLSHNINLETLNISKNDFMMTINLSQNNQLKYFYASENILKSLDLTQNPLLVIVDLKFNQITRLDISQNSVLEGFYAGDNDLHVLNAANGNNILINDEFDIVNNPNLTCVLVDDVAFSNNNWSKDNHTLFNDVKCETYVPDDIFEVYLETHDALGNSVPLGDLTSMGNGIDDDDYVSTAAIENVVSLALPFQIPAPGQVIDPATLVSNLTGLEDFSALVDFDIRFQNISNLDVTENLNLETLTCYNSTVANIDVSTNLQLESLILSGNEIMTLDITNNTQLIELNIASNNIEDIDLSNNTLLEEARLNFNQLSTIDLSHNTLLQKTFLNSNQLTSVNLKNGNNGIINTFIATGNSNLTCILVDNAVDFTADWENFIDAQTSFNDVSCNIQISPKVFLQGAALNPNSGEESLMRDDLREAGYINTISPYDPDSMDASVLAITGDNAIVDWIFIELRDANDNTLVITDTSALLQRDGDVVATDGISPVTMGITSGDYYISIKHRNHLGIMTATAISLSNIATVIDFTDANNQITYGADAQTTFGVPSGVVVMWAGDANGDGRINYSGSLSDVPSIRGQVFNDPNNSIFGGPPVASYLSEGYLGTDLDMDGFTVYSGATSDVLKLRNNIFNNPSNSIFGGPPTSTYVFTQQLPEGAN